MICSLAELPQNRAVPLISYGDGQVQQLDIHDYYDLGKQTEVVKTAISKIDRTIEVTAIFLPLFRLRMMLDRILHEPCALLPASQRAARAIITALQRVVPDDVSLVFDPDKSPAMVEPYQLSWIKNSISDFETILKNDMPEMSTFAVAQIGILRTDDLIRCAYRQISEPLRNLLKEKAKADIVEAGKCLAFRVSTASAFHACRAIETGIDQYIEVLTGKPYEVSLNGGNNNWGAKTDALEKAGAEEKVTEFLTHIRKQYRNPVTHPEVVVDEREAVDLFVASLSAISMMLGAVKKLTEKNQLLLPGYAEAMEALNGSGDAPVGEVQSSDAQNPVSVES